MMATSVASGAPLPETDLLVAQSRELARSHLRGRDGLASLVLGTAFAVAATALAVLAHSTRPFERSVLRFVNSWHAFGAAFVLVLAGQPAPSPEHFPVWGLALLAQFAFDF